MFASVAIQIRALLAFDDSLAMAAVSASAWNNGPGLAGTPMPVAPMATMKKSPPDWDSLASRARRVLLHRLGDVSPEDLKDLVNDVLLDVFRYSRDHTVYDFVALTVTTAQRVACDHILVQQRRRRLLRLLAEKRDSAALTRPAEDSLAAWRSWLLDLVDRLHLKPRGTLSWDDDVDPDVVLSHVVAHFFRTNGLDDCFKLWLKRRDHTWAEVADEHVTGRERAGEHFADRDDEVRRTADRLKKQFSRCRQEIMKHLSQDPDIGPLLGLA